MILEGMLEGTFNSRQHNSRVLCVLVVVVVSTLDVFTLLNCARCCRCLLLSVADVVVFCLFLGAGSELQLELMLQNGSLVYHCFSSQYSPSREWLVFPVNFTATEKESLLSLATRTLKAVGYVCCCCCCCCDCCCCFRCRRFVFVFIAMLMSLPFRRRLTDGVVHMEMFYSPTKGPQVQYFAHVDYRFAVCYCCWLSPLSCLFGTAYCSWQYFYELALTFPFVK